MLHDNGVEVPHTHLTPEALHTLAEEFVTRDGTDYGRVEKTLEEKVAALMRQLERGEAAILYEHSYRTIPSSTSTPTGQWSDPITRSLMNARLTKGIAAGEAST